VLRAVIAAAVDEVPPLLADVLAGESPLVAGQGAALQFERFNAVADLLERAGKETVAVVLLDDLQWADSASLELLQLLATRLTRGVLIVTTVRTLELGHAGPVTDALAAVARRPGSRRVRLRGLSPTATGELLGAVTSSPVAPELVARIHERAEGNPFYVMELSRLFDDGVRTGEVPATVRDAIRRRLGLLPDGTVDLLTVAAVVGRDVDVPLVARVAGLDMAACLDRLDPAAAHRVLEDSPSRLGALRFSHALVREVLVDDLTPLRRSRLHLAVADAMSDAAGGDDAVDRDDVEVLAGHLWQAVSLGIGARAAASLERAAETAISRVAYDQAEELLARAAQLRRTSGTSTEAKEAELATVLRLLEVMQAIRYFAGTDREVLQRAQALAGELGVADVARKTAWSEWAGLSTSGHLRECRPMADAYLARWCDDPRPQVAAAAHVLYGVDEWTRARIDAAIEHLDRAVALLATAPPPADAFEGEYTIVAHAFSCTRTPPAGTCPSRRRSTGSRPPRHRAARGGAGRVRVRRRHAAAHLRWDEVERLVDRALHADPSAQFAFFGGQLLMQRGSSPPPVGPRRGRRHLPRGEDPLPGRWAGSRPSTRTRRCWRSCWREPDGCARRPSWCRAPGATSTRRGRAGRDAVAHRRGRRRRARRPPRAGRGAAGHRGGPREQKGSHAFVRRAEAVADELSVTLPHR
jgi:hypothetical protein